MEYSARIQNQLLSDRTTSTNKPPAHTADVKTQQTTTTMQYSDTMRILSIDSSLSGTGLGRLVLDPYWKPDVPTGPGDVIIPPHQFDLVTLKAPKKRGKLLDTSRRITYLIDHISAAMLAETFDLIVLEDIPYSAQPNHPLTWLWGRIIDLCADTNQKLLVVNVSTVKSFATGIGNAKKDVVMLAMANRYPELGIADNNQADSAALGMIGARFLGHPVDHMPKKHLESKGLRELELQT